MSLARAERNKEEGNSDLSVGQCELILKIAYDAEIAILAVLSKRQCTLDFSKMFGRVLMRDLWHDGREWPRDPIPL